MSENVNFYQGSKENYNPSEMQGGLYFSKDSKEILLNGESYGNATPADEEDITAEDGNLKLKDRAYDEANFSGKGYKILRKNIQNGKNILTQDMINEPNTVYEIRYDFDLNGAKAVVPEGSVLKFNGGSINNGQLNSSFSDNDFLAIGFRGVDIYSPRMKVDRVDIDFYYKGDLTQAIEEIRGIFVSQDQSEQSYITHPVFINLSQNSSYDILSGNIKLPTRFSIGCLNGMSEVCIRKDFDVPTNIIEYYRDGAGFDASDTTVCNLNIRNINANNVILLNFPKDESQSINLCVATKINLSNLHIMNHGSNYLHLAEIHGYCDRCKFYRIVRGTYLQSDQIEDYGIDVIFDGRGDGVQIEQCGEGLTFLFTGATNVLGISCVNLNYFVYGGNLTLVNCYNESGSIRSYCENINLIGSQWYNTRLQQTSKIYLDDSQVKTLAETYPNVQNLNKSNSSHLTISDSVLAQWLNNRVPSSNIEFYKLISGGNNIHYYNTQFNNYGGTLIFNPYREYTESIINDVQFRVSAAQHNFWYAASHNESIETYQEAYNTNLVINVYVYYDKQRNIGFTSSRTLSQESLDPKKFVAVAIDNPHIFKDLYMEVYVQYNNKKLVYKGYLGSTPETGQGYTYLTQKSFACNFVGETFDQLPPDPIQYNTAKFIGDNILVTIDPESEDYILDSENFILGDRYVIGEVIKEYDGDSWIVQNNSWALIE